MNPVNTRGLVPPRPNLGPEPWSDPEPIAVYVWVAGALAFPLLVWLVRKRLRRARGGRPGLDLSIAGERDTTPRGRLVALSRAIRERLASQFGTAWRAKTTEELAAEPRLAEALGLDRLQELIRFLDQVDRLKFAPERSIHHHDSLERELAAWEPRIADLEKKLIPKIRPRHRP